MTLDADERNVRGLLEEFAIVGVETFGVAWVQGEYPREFRIEGIDALTERIEDGVESNAAPDLVERSLVDGGQRIANAP
jgi:hypothetical protein